MKKFCKIVYYSSIVFIAVAFGIGILIETIPLEWSSITYKENIGGALFFGVPIAILLTITRTGFKKIPDNKVRFAVLKSVLLALGYFLLIGLYGIISFGSGLCLWSTRDTILVNKIDRSTRIVVRDFGCGAVDSSPLIYDTFKEKEITCVFLHYNRVKMNELDTTEWSPKKR
jgi:hypothetical protein